MNDDNTPSAPPSPDDPAAAPGRPRLRAARREGAAAPPRAPVDDGRDRIAKVLSRAGVASRRDAERMIAAGRVRLNGRPVTTPAIDVGPKDRISVDGADIPPPEPVRIWLYHKPAGLVTTARDEEGRPTVFDNLPEGMPYVMTVGRLDLTSEGLLLLTNDGEIKRRLELPSTGWLRRYRVRINGALSEAQLAELRAGVTVDGIVYQPMEVTFDRQQGANAWLTVGLREGKNREIRRVMEYLGVQVSRLIRVSYGPFQLGNLAEGAVEELRAKVVRDQLGLGPDRGVGPVTRSRTAGVRAAADGPKRTYAPRTEGDDRPPRKPRAATGDRPQRTYAPRTEGDDRPPRKPRATTGDGPKRTYAPRTEGDDRPPRKPRAATGDRPQRTYAPRTEGDDRPPRKPRATTGDGPKRSYAPRSQGDDRKPRAASGDGPKRPHAPRPEGDRPKRSFTPRSDGPRSGPGGGGKPGGPRRKG